VREKVVMEWSKLEDSISSVWVEANFWLFKFIVNSIEGKTSQNLAMPIISIFL